ncbi:hypothetical protein [uncultured Kordia sp.]|uniref:hypothetical protein n=1 Tax=uncultured Kordia sp. TaxID=507699 RepID=UPI0026136B20|nr:hypothetical protein [uncultured Kordia sp.]
MDKEISKYSLDYFKGIFHTYALQNDPGINVFYSFDIDDFATENTIEESLIKNIKYLENYELTFEKITKEDFENLLNGWLFAEFRPNSIKHISTINTTKHLVDTLVSCFGITTYHKMISIKNDGKNAENDFGYAIDFVVLSSETKRYLCEFTIG